MKSPAGAVPWPPRSSATGWWTRTGRPAGELAAGDLDHLRRSVRTALRDAIRNGGAHTGRFTPHRGPGGRCPRCGTELERATIGGRTTFWCPVCQPL